MGLKDIAGRRFGRLVVIERAANDSRGAACWRVLCDCGECRVVWGSNLRRGLTTSCGCLCKEHLLKTLTKHGHACVGKTTVEYRAYQGAKARCTNPNGQGYANYGGRGVEFRFNSFDEWYAELGDKPEPKRLYSIDRIDNEGHYEKGNVKWSTAREQRRNQRERPNGSSLLKGVCQPNRQKDKWIAQITFDGKTKYLGYFDSEVAAALTYDRAAREHFGEFACVNFPTLASVLTAVGAA